VIRSNVTLDHLRHPPKGRFHAFGIQTDPWDGGDRLGSHPIPVVKPKDSPISHQNFADVKLADNFVNLAERNDVVHRKATSTSGSRLVRRRLFGECFGLAGISFPGQLGLEVVEHYAGCNNFEKSKDRVLMPGMELPQLAAFIRAQLEIGFLDEVVEQMRRSLGPRATRGSRHNLGDQRLKSANEFRPSGFVMGTDALFD